MPKQKVFKEMENQAIEKLEDLAEKYAFLRDQRMKLTKDEVELKSQIAREMNAAKKKHYQHNGIEIDISAEDKIHVRVKRAGGDKEGD